MIGGIIVSHASFATGVCEAVEMIAGKQDALCAISLKEGDGLEILMERIRGCMSSMNCNEYVVFVDLFGATPCHAACVLSAQRGIHVAAGVNLPLMLEFVMKREDATMEELKDCLQKTSEQDYRWLDQSDLV